MKQMSIDFTKPVVHSENNNDSQKLFEENESRFRGQCKTVMKALLRGEKLTVVSAMQKYKIGDLRRRIKDLRDNYNVKCIKENLLENRFKEWYIDKK